MSQFQLPWEQEAVKRVIDLFDCTVLTIERVDDNDQTLEDSQE